MEYLPDSPEAMPPRPTWSARLRGFGLVLLSVLMLAALLTYHGNQVSWQWLHPTATPALPCTNAFGPLGMYAAGMVYWLLGAGAVYAFALLLPVGFAQMLHPEEKRMGQWAALLALIICACSLLSVQTEALLSWSAAQGLHTPGGNLGYLDGSCVLEPLLGQTGALCLLLALHWVGLLYFSRLTFRSFCTGVRDDMHRLAAWYRARRERRAAAKEAKRQAWLESMAHRAEQAANTNTLQPSYAADPAMPQQTQPAPVPPPLEEHQLPPSFSEQIAQAKQEEAQRVPLQTASSGRHRRYAPPVIKSTRANLLDLMEDVEKEITLSTEPGAPEPELQPRREPARNTPRAPRQPAPAPTPAPKPAPKPVPPRTAPAPAKRDDRPQESDYPLPPYELLRYEPVSDEMNEAAQTEMAEMQKRIIDTFASFRIEVLPGDITRGPSITRYEFIPPVGTLMGRFESLGKNLMAATQSASINILAPVPGKNTVAVELANSTKSPVFLRELLQSPNFKNPKLHIPVALGKDVYGNAVIGDLAKMPHTLVAGTTGSGKSVCINSMILSMLYKFRPDELKLILVDPKVVEMQPYSKLPHLACPVVTSPSRVIGALRWAVNEMEKRYSYFSRVGVRNFVDFNARDPMQDPDGAVSPDEVDEDYYAKSDVASDIVREIEDSNDGRDIADEDEETQGEFDFNAGDTLPAKLPYVVIIIDELADLMQQVKEDLENNISRLTQKARAAGIHLVAATQTPRSNVVTGTIKANIPSRIALKVASPLDSRIILETKGAENLLGNGDLLFLPPGGISQLTRVQGAFVSDAEIQQIIAFCASHAKQHFEQGVTAEMNNADGAPAPDNDRLTSKGMSDEDAELYNRCVAVVISERKASTSLLQRRLHIGYGRAAAMIDKMEQHGIIGPSQGASRPREVLVEE